jgi:hypothetical protein
MKGVPRPQNKLLSHKSRHEWCHTKLTTAAREERGDPGRAGLAELLQAVRTERLLSEIIGRTIHRDQC